MPLSATERIAEIDRRLVRVAKEISVLGALSWPPRIVEAFLDSWRAGRPKLPTPPRVEPVPEQARAELRDIATSADTSDPRGRWLAATAESYRAVSDMLGQPGTATFHTLSREVYGSPGDPLIGTSDTQLSAADQLLESTGALHDATRESEYDYCITAEHVAADIRQRLDAFFTDDRIKVVIDPNLGAKAAASARRIRIRGATCFSRMDVAQLCEHEAFVHSATALNGRKQPLLGCLSLSTPRTTATQEGLATFAELVTGSIDLARLRRIALRIRAVHIAEEGGDFVDVFRYVLSAGQTESESVRTAARIFRGGDPRGRHVFTKDVVYLRGILGVHTFLRKAIADNNPELIRRLFVGRLSAQDVFTLEESYESGEIVAARYVPEWASNTRALAAQLSFSLLLNRIDIGRVQVTDLFRREAAAV